MEEIVICGLKWANAELAAEDLTGFDGFRITPLMVTRFMNATAGKRTEEHIAKWAVKLFKGQVPDEMTYHHATPYYCDCEFLTLRGKCKECEPKKKTVSVFDLLGAKR